MILLMLAFADLLVILIAKVKFLGPFGENFGGPEGGAGSLQGSSVSHLNFSINGSTQDDFGGISLQAQRNANKLKDIKNRIIIYFERSQFRI